MQVEWQDHYCVTVPQRPTKLKTSSCALFAFCSCQCYGCCNPVNQSRFIGTIILTDLTEQQINTEKLEQIKCLVCSIRNLNYFAPATRATLLVILKSTGSPTFNLQSRLSNKFLNWQEQVRMKSVLILKIFARVRTLEVNSYNHPPVSVPTGVCLHSFFANVPKEA